ncbi:MAG TPA: hypothetical protein DCM73_09525 [Clostridiales bacterium]|nr:hypothetical protein [Clostridiales bacterium]
MDASYKTLKILCAAIALCLFCVSVYGYSSKEFFYDTMEEINIQHTLEAQDVSDVNINDYTPAMEGREVAFSADELDSMTDYGKYKGAASQLTYEQASEDVGLAFRILKNCYGAYFYFGGNEVFEKANEQVLSDCKRAGENLTVGILREALKKNLSFIKDGPFWIDNEPVFAKSIYYSNEETVFLKDKNGYYMEQGGKKRYVLSVDGSDAVESYMKRSIDNKGMLVYKIGMLSVNNKETVQIGFENGTVNFVLTSPESEKLRNENYSCYEINNVSVVAVSSFMDEQAGRNFISSADTIKNSRIAILDLRGNRGGMSKYVTDWLDIYDSALSEYAGGNAYAYRRSRAADYLIYRNLEKYLSKQEAEYLLNNYRAGNNHWETEKTTVFKRSGNDNYLFVLVDSRTFSAGEWLIAALRNKDNVIFVGTNSGGGLMNDSAIKIALPGSRINIQLGCELRFYYDETIFSEETGFSPDIWVSTDAMQYTLNLISYYGLD